MTVWTSDNVSLGSVLDVQRYLAIRESVAATIEQTAKHGTRFGSADEGDCYHWLDHEGTRYATPTHPQPVSCDQPHHLQLFAVVALDSVDAAQPDAFRTACEQEALWRLWGPLPDRFEVTSFSWAANSWEGMQDYQALCFVVGDSDESLVRS